MSRSNKIQYKLWPGNVALTFITNGKMFFIEMGGHKSLKGLGYFVRDITYKDLNGLLLYKEGPVPVEMV